MVKVFDALKGAIQKQQDTISSLQRQSQDFSASEQAAAEREVTEWFDGSVEKLCQEHEEFKEALGEGRYGSLQQGSSQHANRDAIANQAAVLLAGYQASGQNAPPRDEVFQAAARLVLHDKYSEVEKKALSTSLKKRSGQHIKRAGGKPTKQNQHQDPVDEVAAELNEKYFS